MNRTPFRMKVSFDVFLMQSIITLWYLGILLIIHFAPIFINFGNKNGFNDIYAKIYISGNIFMFVIGIIAAVGILPFYVKNGVTRKDSYIGIATGTMGLAIAIPIIAFLLNLITTPIFNWLDVPIKPANLTEIAADPGDPFFAHLILSIVGPPAIEGISFLSLALFMLNLFFYYVIGWMIGSGFYRSNGITGFLYIILAVFLFALNAQIWGKGLFVDLFIPNLSAYSYGASFAGTIFFITIVLLIIRLTTKNIRIKL